MVVWLQFIACSALILVSGARLSSYGDIIARRSGMGHTWIGVALLASATSLPELITGISAVAIYDLPNIAVGDALGSCLFNLLILAILDGGIRRIPVASVVGRGHILTAGFGILLLGITAMSLLVSSRTPIVGWVSLSSILLIGIWLLAMRSTFRHERKDGMEKRQGAAEPSDVQVSNASAYTRFVLYALMVVAGGCYLPRVADGVISFTGLSGTVVGTAFVACSTSLPELIVTMAAVRMGLADMAVGNILGSNLFDVMILAMDDIAYRRGSLFESASADHVVTALGAMTMTGIWIITMVARPRGRVFFLSAGGFGIAAVYAAVYFVLLFGSVR